MNSFTLQISGSIRSERFVDLVSFVGKDQTGSFGLRPGAERFMTTLSFGLAKFVRSNGATEHLAFPGGLLYFASNVLRISTRVYIRHSDPEVIARLYRQQLEQDAQIIKEVRHNLHQLDQEIFKKLTEESYGLNL